MPTLLTQVTYHLNILAVSFYSPPKKKGDMPLYWSYIYPLSSMCSYKKNT